MTEKRYKLSEPNGAYLIDNDRPYAHWINDDDKIIDLLNDLVDENEQLKSTLYYLLNVIQNKCPKYYPKCKEIVRSCFENDSTNSRNEKKGVGYE